MIGILILSLSIIFAGALPWWPYSATGRLQYHRPWDWLMDSGAVSGERVRRDPRDHAIEAPTSKNRRDAADNYGGAKLPGKARATRRTGAARTGRDLLVA
jgi:hypothetical protein